MKEVIYMEKWYYLGSVVMGHIGNGVYMPFETEQAYHEYIIGE